MKNVVMILICVILLWSCQNDDDGSPASSEFSIEAKIEDHSLSYEQTIFDGGSDGNVNVFNRVDKTLLLQSFKNGENDSEGFWTIRINEVDIENVTLPYNVTGVEGSITWVDESAKALQEPCSAADVICFYSGVGVDEVKITITSVENNTISGTFEGDLAHIRLNPNVIRDTDDIAEVVEGQFNIRFQTK